MVKFQNDINGHRLTTPDAIHTIQTNKQEDKMAQYRSLEFSLQFLIYVYMYMT